MFKQIDKYQSKERNVITYFIFRLTQHLRGPIFMNKYKQYSHFLLFQIYQKCRSFVSSTVIVCQVSTCVDQRELLPFTSLYKTLIMKTYSAGKAFQSFLGILYTPNVKKVFHSCGMYVCMYAKLLKALSLIVTNIECLRSSLSDTKSNGVFFVVFISLIIQPFPS